MISKLHQNLSDHTGTCTSIVSGYLSAIEKQDKEINAFISVQNDAAMEKARSLDEKCHRVDAPGLLTGIPIAIKDNICTKDVPTTCASKILENFVPPYNATVIEKLLAADAVLIGKTNLDEFAMGSSTETSYFNTSRNPNDPDYIPGGSSGGSAAAVAAGEAVAALGSDTGGSIRQPAAHCGVVGLKPTYGRVSRYGLVAFASSLDQIGPFAVTVEDAARVLQVIAGYDPKDSTSVDQPVPDYLAELESGVKGLRVGIPQEYFGEGLDPQVKEIIMDRIGDLEKAGAEIKSVSLPNMAYAIAAYYIICTAEASSNLARYDGVKYGYRCEDPKDLRDMYCRTRKEGFGDEVKRRIMLGTYVLSSGYYDAYYLKASRVRTLIAADFKKVFEQCDVLASPVTPAPAFKIGEKVDDPLQMYLLDSYTVSVNLAGLPGISVPAGKIGKLPVGMQLIGKAFDEETVLRAARTVEALG